MATMNHRPTTKRLVLRPAASATGLSGVDDAQAGRDGRSAAAPEGPDLGHEYASAGAGITEIRLANFLLLIRDYQAEQKRSGARATDADFARLVGIVPKYMGHLRARRRNIGHQMARKVERALGLPANWLDVPHEQTPAVRMPKSEIPATAPSAAGPSMDAASAEALLLEQFKGDAGLPRLADMLRRLAGTNYVHGDEAAAARVRNAVRALVAGSGGSG